VGGGVLVFTEVLGAVSSLAYLPVLADWLIAHVSLAV